MPLDQTRRDELAHFLRSRRERLDPADFGITVRQRRRAVGLRREEISDAAGISTTWYVWLEQGRNVNASAQALRALGKALRLSRSEQSYLFQLARPDLEWQRGLVETALPSANLLALIDGLAPHPAYVSNRHRQVVATNQAARVLLGDFNSDDPVTGSVIARLFLDPQWRQLFVDWEIVARSSVAQFRLATAALAGDPVLASQVSYLTESSDTFARWWNDRELADPPIWLKTLRHPLVGDMCFDFAALQPRGRDSDFVVSLYTPGDEPSRNRLARLLASDRGGGAS